MSSIRQGKGKVAEETKMLCKFYQTEGRAPSRKEADPGDEAAALECRLCEWLRHIRRKDNPATTNVQVAYVRRHAPQLLSQRPKDLKLLHDAHMCVAWVQAGRRTTHPEAQRFTMFLYNRKRELSGGTRHLDDDVCRVLCEGIPGWADTIKGAESGHQGADAETGDMAYDDTCDSMDTEVPPVEPSTPFEQAAQPIASPPSLLAPQVSMDVSDEMDVDVPPPAAVFRGRGRASSRGGVPAQDAAYAPATSLAMPPVKQMAVKMPSNLSVSGTGATKRSWSEADFGRPLSTDDHASSYPAANGKVEERVIIHKGVFVKPQNYPEQHFVHYRLADSEGLRPLALIVHDAKENVPEYGEVGVVIPEYSIKVRAFELSGVLKKDPYIKCSLTDVVSFLEGTKELLEKWFGRSMVWPPIDGCGVLLTFDAYRLNSFPQGSSSGGALLLALLRLLSGVRLRGLVAITGVLSPSGHLLSVASVPAKLAAAKRMGADCAIIPLANYLVLQRTNALKEYESRTMKVLPARDVAEILHHCVDIEGMGGMALPPIQQMRHQLAARLSRSRVVVMVKMARWTSTLHWEVVPLEATATVKLGVGRGKVELRGAGEEVESTLERVVGGAERWICRFQTELESLHGRFYIDFSTMTHIPTGLPVYVQLVAKPGDLGLDYMVPIAASLISIATGRAVKEDVALQTHSFPTDQEPENCFVSPVLLPLPDSKTALTPLDKIAGGMNTLGNDWGLKMVVMEEKEGAGVQEARVKGKSPQAVQILPVKHVFDAINKVLQPHRDARSGGLVMHEEPSGVRAVMETIMGPLNRLIYGARP